MKLALKVNGQSVVECELVLEEGCVYLMAGGYSILQLGAEGIRLASDVPASLCFPLATGDTVKVLKETY